MERAVAAVAVVAVRMRVLLVLLSVVTVSISEVGPAVSVAGAGNGWSWTPPGSCPYYCMCYAGAGLRRADCREHRLASVDLALPKDVEAADLSGNIISTLADGCFQELGLVQLVELNLRHNAIHTIEPWAFAGLRRLSAVDLSYNHLQVLYPNTFAGNRGLKVLLLAGNNLARLPTDRPLLTAPRLQVLDLSSCRLAHVGAAVLSELPALASLNLSANHLIQLHPQTLARQSQLQIIDLTRNPLECDLNTLQLLQHLKAVNVTVRHSCPAEGPAVPKHLARLLTDVIPDAPRNAPARDGPVRGGISSRDITADVVLDVDSLGRAPGRAPGRTHERLQDFSELQSLLAMHPEPDDLEEVFVSTEIEDSSEEQPATAVPNAGDEELEITRRTARCANTRNPALFSDLFDPIPSFWASIFGFNVGFVVALLVSNACRRSVWRALCECSLFRRHPRGRRRGLGAHRGAAAAAAARPRRSASVPLLWTASGYIRDDTDACCPGSGSGSGWHQDDDRDFRVETPPPAYSEVVEEAGQAGATPRAWACAPSAPSATGTRRLSA